jgi:hypothetical protein
MPTRSAISSNVAFEVPLSPNTSEAAFSISRRFCDVSGLCFVDFLVLCSSAIVAPCSDAITMTDRHYLSS